MNKKPFDRLLLIEIELLQVKLIQYFQNQYKSIK